MGKEADDSISMKPCCNERAVAWEGLAGRLQLRNARSRMYVICNF